MCVVLMHITCIGLGVKYVSDQRTMSELIDGEMMLQGKHFYNSCRTKKNENGIGFKEEGHIPKLRPHEH